MLQTPGAAGNVGVACHRDNHSDVEGEASELPGICCPSKRFWICVFESLRIGVASVFSSFFLFIWRLWDRMCFQPCSGCLENWVPRGCRVRSCFLPCWGRAGQELLSAAGDCPYSLPLGPLLLQNQQWRLLQVECPLCLQSLTFCFSVTNQRNPLLLKGSDN